MATVEVIAQRPDALPEGAQQEVLDFIEFLQSRRKCAIVRENDRAWSDFSLASAMRGMGDESAPFTTDDLKESFR